MVITYMIMASAVPKVTSVLLARNYSVFGIFNVQSTSPTLYFSSSVRKVKFPDPPKQPSSVFLKFVKHKRVFLQRSQPGITSVDIVRQAAVEWKILSHEQKKAYKEMYDDEYVQYRRLKEEWWNSLTEQQRAAYSHHLEEVQRAKDHREFKKKLRQLGKPKRPLTAFNFFMSQSEIKGESHKIAFANVTKFWKNLSDVGKKPFIELAEKDNKRYKDEMTAWELKMMAEGHDELLRQNSKVIKENHERLSKKSDRPSASTHKVGLVQMPHTKLQNIKD